MSAPAPPNRSLPAATAGEHVVAVGAVEDNVELAEPAPGLVQAHVVVPVSRANEDVLDLRRGDLEVGDTVVADINLQRSVAEPQGDPVIRGVARDSQRAIGEGSGDGRFRGGRSQREAEHGCCEPGAAA